MPDAFDAVAWIADLRTEDVPEGLQIRSGATVTNSSAFVAYLRGALALEPTATLHKIAADDARDLRDALAAIPA